MLIPKDFPWPENPSRNFDFLIGSRENLLHCEGDIIINTTLDIVETLLSQGVTNKCVETQKFMNIVDPEKHIVIFYGEVYGGKIGSHKQYSLLGLRSFRMFDINLIHADTAISLMKKDLKDVSSWRDNTPQLFLCVKDFFDLSKKANLESVPEIKIDSLPESIEDTHELLRNLANVSLCGLDFLKGKPEGIVVRNNDRTKITKIRYEDYERFLKKSS